MNELAQDRWDRLLLRVAVVSVAMALLAGAAVVGLHREASSSAQSRPAVIVVPPAHRWVVDGANVADLPVDLRRFALNALLAPLLDDDDPPRWTDVALDHLCDPGTKVLVNGAPLVPGSPVPRQAFSVRWDMNRCEPMGPAMPLSGRVELSVTHEATGMRAIVRPQTLQVHGAGGRVALLEPFTADLALVALATDP